MKLEKQEPKTPLGRRVDELHRPPTRFERFREWIEGLPKIRLFVFLIVFTWLALTALIGLGPRPPVERIIAQGILERGDLAQLESGSFIQSLQLHRALRSPRPEDEQCD